MTLSEYEMYDEAFQLRQADDELKIHEHAWANQIAKATDKKGKHPKYKTFKEFYKNSYDEQIDKIMSVYEGIYDSESQQKADNLARMKKVSENIKKYENMIKVREKLRKEVNN